MSAEARSSQGRFLKGHSGNRNGRPLRPTKLEPLIALILNEKVAMKIGSRSLKVTRLEALLRIHFDECIRTKKLDPRTISFLGAAASHPSFELKQGDKDELMALLNRVRS